jgi:hypothetical protein
MRSRDCAGDGTIWIVEGGGIVGGEGDNFRE